MAIVCRCRSLSRRAFAAAVACIVAGRRDPALAEPAEPLVSPQWLKEHQCDPALVVLDIRSAIDGGGAEAYAKAHIPGAVHSDYDKAGWRVTRNGVPFMLPSQAGAREAHRRNRHRRGQPRGRRAGRRAAPPTSASAARVYWTLKVAGHPAVSILDGGFAAWQAAAYPVESGKITPSPKIFTRQARRAPACAEVEAVETQRATPRCVDARPASFFDGKEKAPASKAYGHIPGAINLDSATFYDPATNRLRSKDAARRDRRVAAGRPGGDLLQHRPLGGDRLVRAVGGAGPAGRAALRRLDGRMDRRPAVARSRASRTRLDDLKKALGLRLLSARRHGSDRR